MTTLILAFLAGVLTLLSPCILPVITILVGSSLSKHRLAPMAMGLGIAASFISLGVLVSMTGSILGLSETVVKQLSASWMIICGMVLLSQKAYQLFSRFTMPLANWGQSHLTVLSETHPTAYFLMGFLLGAVWSPCFGPTLGGIIGVANITIAGAFDTGIVLASYSLGTLLPILLLSYGSRTILSNRKKLCQWVEIQGKRTFALCLTVIGIFVLFGIDKTLEASLLDSLPHWWLNLISTY